MKINIWLVSVSNGAVARGTGVWYYSAVEAHNAVRRLRETRRYQGVHVTGPIACDVPDPVAVFEVLVDQWCQRR